MGRFNIEHKKGFVNTRGTCNSGRCYLDFCTCRYPVYSLPVICLSISPSPYITLINTRRSPLTRFIDKRTRLIRADFSHLKNIIMLGMQMHISSLVESLSQRLITGACVRLFHRAVLGGFN